MKIRIAKEVQSFPPPTDNNKLYSHQIQEFRQERILRKQSMSFREVLKVGNINVDKKKEDGGTTKEERKTFLETII